VVAVLTAEEPGPVTGTVLDEAAGAIGAYSKTGEMIKARMPQLVKGAGYVGGNEPLRNQSDIMARSHQATLDLRTTTRRGYTSKSAVVGGLNPRFLDDFGYLKAALTAPTMFEQMQRMFQALPGGAEAIKKSFTAGNLGIGSIYGLAPFDLRAPSRLIYPVNN
jgi:hypothetical protein